MGIGFLAKDNTGIPSFRFTSLEAAPCPEDGPCAGMEGENLEYCNHFVDGCMAHLPPDDHQHHHHDDHSAHDDGHDDDHHYDDDHDDYEDEDRVACDSNDDCNGGFCNFDNGDLGFCEPCYHFGSVEECKNSGLPDAGAEACEHRCFDGGEHIKLNAAEKKKMENYRAYIPIRLRRRSILSCLPPPNIMVSVMKSLLLPPRNRSLTKKISWRKRRPSWRSQYMISSRDREKEPFRSRNI